MIRKIIQINEEKCNGCGLCANACHEGAIGIVNGKATLLRDDYCDGMGDCLPQCPTGAISFTEREAAAYDEAAVKANMAKNKAAVLGKTAAGNTESVTPAAADIPQKLFRASKLQNWPVQIKLAPISAPYFNGAKLLITADCTAYAYASFHEDFLSGRIALVGCPKLDAIDYSEKLQAIIENNDIQSITLVRMEVPCCGGLEMAAKKALQQSGKTLPWQVVTITIDGRIKE